MIIVFSIAQIGFIKTALADLTVSFEWPGLNVLNAKGEAPTSATYNLNYANAAGHAAAGRRACSRCSR